MTVDPARLCIRKRHLEVGRGRLPFQPRISEGLKRTADVLKLVFDGLLCPARQHVRQRPVFLRLHEGTTGQMIVEHREVTRDQHVILKIGPVRRRHGTRLFEVPQVVIGEKVDVEVWDLSPSESYVAICAYTVVVLGLKLTFCLRSMRNGSTSAGERVAWESRSPRKRQRR